MINHVIGTVTDIVTVTSTEAVREIEEVIVAVREDNARDRDQGRDRSRVTEASNEKEDNSKDKTGHDYGTEKASKQRSMRFTSNSAEQHNFLSL